MPAIYLSIQEHPACIGLGAVFVDGVEAAHCVAAHEGEGWADIDVVDARGLMTGEERRLQGRVEIRPIGGATRADLERIAAGDSFTRALCAQIVDAEHTGDRDRAEYLKGVLDLYQRTLPHLDTAAAWPQPTDAADASAEHLQRLEKIAPQ